MDNYVLSCETLTNYELNFIQFLLIKLTDFI